MSEPTGSESLFPAGYPPLVSRLVLVGVVAFDGTGQERTVVRDCAVCLAGQEVYGCGVVSPSGIAHIGMGGGRTKCGKDATGDSWWWPI